MIICTVCQQKQLIGALFCDECGTGLMIDPASAANGTPETIYTPEPSLKPKSSVPLPSTPDFIQQVVPPGSAPSSPFGETRFGLYILPSGPFLPLLGGEEHTIGRVSGDQPILPDIDLTPYDAFAKGVSRLHTTLHVEGDQLTVTDLGSANGTRLNGQKLPPYDPKSLSDGDVLALGLLQLRVEIRQAGK